MKTGLTSGAAKVFGALLCMMNLCLLSNPVQVLGAGAFPGMAYCSVPPLPGSGFKPNLLLMMDNSASMYDPAYTDPSAFCIDDTYEFDTGTQQFDRTITYPGYFDQGTMYSYNSSTDAFEAATVTMPAGCSDVNLSYLCVSIDKSVKPQVTTSFIASGKFLNWLTMSKLDIEKKVLTGGKFEPDQNKTSGKLIGETRGCQGKRFVKFTRDATGVTFAVRGPHSSDSDYLYTAGHGGGTRIEIYNKTYNKTACLAAVSDWQNKSSVSDLQRDAGNCLGETNLTEGTDKLYGKIPTASKVYVDILSNCFGNPTRVLYDNTVLDDCKKRIHGAYSNNPDIILEDAQDSICAEGVNHALTINYDINSSLVPDSKGFLGKCYQKGLKIFIANSNVCTSADALACASPGATITCDVCCAEQEAEDYCRAITNPSLTDPLTRRDMPANGAVVPSFILDAGVYTTKGVAGVLRARLSVAAHPTGLIQEFSGDINFGVMSFNDNGAGSECKHLVPSLKNGGIVDGDIPCVKQCIKDTTDSNIDCQQDSDCDTLNGFVCRENSQTDGGKVISAIGSPLEDPDSVHLGLISSLNQVTANAWTPLAESFYNALSYFANRSGALNTSFAGTPPSQFNCQKNNVLIVSDGISTADRNGDVMGLVAEAVKAWGGAGTANLPTSLTTAGTEASPPFKGSYNLDDLAWIGRHKNIADFTQDPSAGNYSSIVALTRDAIYNRDSVSTYVVYTGIPCSVYKADKVTCDDTLDDSRPEKMMQMTAANGGGRVAVARNPGDMENAFRAMLQQIAAGSGSDPSIVSTGNANGAIFLREQYYPAKSFDGGLTSASWIGEMQSLWYYIDPFLGSTGSGSTIREDTLADQRLSLRNDKIVNLRYDSAGNRTYASLTTDSGSSGPDAGTETQVELDQLNSLWRAGQKLWERDLVKSPRTLLTPLLTGGTAVNGTGLMQFSSNSINALSPYLNLQPGDPDAAKLIRYVSGFDYPGDIGMRSRTVAITGREVVANPQDTGVGVWKLGDIISSNPQVESPVPLGSYHLPAPRGYSDSSYATFIGSDDYKNRGMVYVGANDGMLHAFNLGKLDATGRLDGSGNPDPNAPADQQATLLGPDLGKEQWAFIPKQVLPYLKYLAHPNYRHLHYVDGNLTLADVKIGGDPAGTQWSTVLIGGMGLGGASATSCAAGNDCVQTPVADPGLGYSSYFALDVTDPGNPTFLWEFSDPALGYSTTGPAIVRSKAVRTGDAGWYAVFGSGPTGPIDPSKQQFLGRSNQNLTFFVVDLLSGALVQTIQTGIGSAFAGSLVGGAIDADRWNPNESDKSKDDAIYVGYTKNSSYLDANQVTVQKSTGGVLRIYPKDWSWSEVVKDIGPVTSGIARLQDKKNKNLWLYFGTGRYFFNQDDMKESRYLYGVKEPCYNRTVRGAVVKENGIDTSCTVLVDTQNLNNQTTIQTTVDASKPGWSIRLAPSTTTLGAERLITNPTAITGGAVFFTTFQPKVDPCLLGDSYLWGVTYYTGGAIPEGALMGKALVQLGTGGMEEVPLSQNIGADDPRRGPPLPGEAGGVKVVTNSGLKPLKKIIHIQER